MKVLAYQVTVSRIHPAGRELKAFCAVTDHDVAAAHF